MKLSIITINYNNLEGLRKTINSVVSQTWRDFEWIVVDGGSTDGSRELIEEYAAKGCFAWWCSEKDKGVYNAMNKGIKHAQGEYLNFMNSGDCFHESTTLEQVFEGKVYDADVLYGDVLLITSPYAVICKEPDYITLSYLRNKTICHQGAFIKLSIQLQYLYDENYKIIADRKLWIQCVQSNYSFFHLQFVVANYDCTGISSVQTLLLKQEHANLWRNLVPNSMNSTIDMLERYEQIVLYYPELKDIYMFLKKRRLYKRLVHILLRFFYWIDSITRK